MEMDSFFLFLLVKMIRMKLYDSKTYSKTMLKKRIYAKRDEMGLGLMGTQIEYKELVRTWLTLKQSRDEATRSDFRVREILKDKDANLFLVHYVLRCLPCSSH